ncbi:hypothetical protein [Arthrobacter sp. MAHUQ-56]
MATQATKPGSSVEVRRDGDAWILPDGSRAGSPQEAMAWVREGRAEHEFPVLVTVIGDQEPYKLRLDSEGMAVLVQEGQDENLFRRVSAMFRRSRWALALAIALVLVLLAALLIPLFAGVISNPGTPSEEASASPAPVAGDVLWTIPGGANLVGSTGDLVASYQAGKLSLREGQTGAEQKLGPFEVPGKPARVLGPELIAVQFNDDKVLVVGSYDSRSTVEGVIQGRGTRPVIVSKDQRKYLTLKEADSGIKELRAVPAGESVLGAVPQGVVFASADSVRVGEAKAVKMTAPAAGARVSAWVAVTNETVVAEWGNTVVIHDIRTGAVLDQAPIGGERTTFDQGVVINGGKTVSGKAFVNLCNGYAVVSGQVWCPSPSGTWTSGSARLPEKPAAAGTSWWIDSKNNVRRLVKGSGQ